MGLLKVFEKPLSLSLTDLLAVTRSMVKIPGKSWRVVLQGVGMGDAGW